MFVYGKEESADVIIEQLLRDRDSIIRYGGVYAVGLAYIGTSDNNAIKFVAPLCAQCGFR
jgi:26S proteasome regulatory subunit N2